MSRDASVHARPRPPVLVLTGVGLTTAVALRSIAALEAQFDVLAPAGTAGRPAERGVVTAEGAIAWLDAAGIQQTHIVGLSFGGAVAQEIAIDHPERVRTLVLGSSTAGGERYVAPEPRVREFVRRLSDLPAEEGLWASVPYLYAARTWRRGAPLIGQDIAQRLSTPLDPRSYDDQLGIARSHDTAERLARISAPTLVLHGEQDRILPLENGRRLADGIAGARFMRVAGGAHAFPTDVPGTTRQLVSFLVAHSRTRAGSAASRSGRATRA